MLKDLAYDYYINHNRNCAESVLLAARDYYCLPLDEAAVRAFGAFGGGMGCGETCGALAASIGAIGSGVITTITHEHMEYKVNANALISSYLERFGNMRCAELQPKFWDGNNRCFEVVAATCDLLERAYPREQ